MGGMHKHETSPSTSTTLRARLLGALLGAFAIAGSFAGAACDPDTLDRSDEEIAAPADEVAPDAQPVDDVEQFTSELDPSAKDTITTCYCGLYHGSPLYVGVNCAGYPGSHVCCADKCSELIGALNGTL